MALVKDNLLTQNHNLRGVGLGLRSCHYPYIESERPSIPWFEVLSDNYLYPGGPSLYHLDKICDAYPVTLHGVGMSIGSTDPLNFDYLKKLKVLIERTNPLLVSDHLAWTSFQEQYFHELFPLPYTEEAISHVVTRIQQIQAFLGQRIMIENASSYLEFSHSTFREWEFLQIVADSADCLILLDINNIYVSAYNNGFNPEIYLKSLSPERVAQFHLGGFTDHKTHLLDTHSAPVHAPVWDLFKLALKQFGALPCCIEWDSNIPDFHRLNEEAKRAQALMDEYAATE